VDRLQQSKLPFVTIGRTAHPHDTWWVDVDYAGLVSRCLHHLADLGHRHVALINRSTELVAAGYGPGHRASSGFRSAATERGVTGVELCCGDDVAAGTACMEELMMAYPEVTGIVTINEAALPGIQHALDDAGLVIPRDFSITGVVANHWAEDFRPPLTAADMPAHDLGTEAVTLLLEQIANPSVPPRHHLVRPPISLRSSTGPARRD